MYNPSRSAKLFIAFIACVAWFALALQLYIMISNTPGNGLTPLTATSQFLGYFTILTNLLVAISMTTVLVIKGKIFGFFSRPSVQTAIAIYIFSVSVGYNILLRHIWEPKGSQLLADELLHDVVPALYVLYWFFFVSAREVKWKDLWMILLYPLCYAIFAVARGTVDGFYAYPFLNVKTIGFASVAKNLAGLSIAVIAISCLLIWIGKKKKPATFN